MAEAGAKPVMEGPTDPVLARFLLNSTIRQLRDEDGRGPNALAAAANTPVSTMKRWLATGNAEWKGPQVLALLGAFGYHRDHPKTQQLLQLTTAARKNNVVGRPEWLRSTAFDLLVALEQVSERIETFEYSVIPGLLQTPEYARAFFVHAGYSDDADLDERVQLRIDRQRLLHRETPGPVQYLAVVDEAVLHRSPAGPDVMRRQLEHLLGLGARENITVQVIPYSAGPYRTEGNGPYVILHSERVGRQITYVETSLAATYFETPEANRRYADAWTRLAARAWGPEKSAEMIRDLLRTT